jgi:hypothetical protein
MAITFTDSRLGPGLLSLGTTEFGVQVSNVKLTPSHDSQDGTPTLGLPKPSPIVATTWTLEGSAIQDWETAEGFVGYTVANNNTEQPFSWTPKADGPSFSGTCLVTAVEFGGDVSTQLTTSFSFAVVGDVIGWSATAPKATAKA